MPRAPRPAPLKPPPLRPGDVVGIVAPASNIEREALEAGCEALRRMGYLPSYFQSILERDLFFAGGEERRVKELHTMFARPDVRAIVCARGGYGCNYLLPRLDLELIRSHPKILVGYSDVTSLLAYLHDATGLITFHGPMLATAHATSRGRAGGPDEFHATSWLNALAGEQNEWRLGNPIARDDETGLIGLTPGAAEGVLYGGCLSILVASVGTPYEIETEGAILFLEDVGEKPYRIDRMLMQLGLAGKLKGVRGVIFGEMKDCTQPGQDYSLEDVVLRVLRRWCPDVPVAFGLHSGHVSGPSITLPFGVRARLAVRGSAAELVILERAVGPLPQVEEDESVGSAAS